MKLLKQVGILASTALIVVTVAIGAANGYRLFAYTSEYGLGIRSDSIRYMWIAENLVNGKGLGRSLPDGSVTLETHWPPLYPVLQAILHSFGFSLKDAQRILAAVSVAAIIVVCGILLLGSAQFSYISFLFILFLSFSPMLWDTSLYAMTESVYMMWVLLAFLFLSVYFKQRNVFWLILSGIMQSLAFMTRYVGISVVLTGLIAVWWLNRRIPLARRMRDMMLLGVVSLTPNLIWFVVSFSYNNRFGNRALRFSPISTEELTAFYRLIADWLPTISLSANIPVTYLTIFVVAAAGFAVLQIGLPAVFPIRFEKVYQIMGLSTVAHGLITFLSKFFFDRFIPLDEKRIWLPIYISLLFNVIWLLEIGLKKLSSGSLFEKSRRFSWPQFLILFTIFFYTFYSAFLSKRESDDLLYAVQRSGLGLARIKAEDLPITPFITQPDPSEIYLTDNLDLLYYFEGVEK